MGLLLREFGYFSSVTLEITMRSELICVENYNEGFVKKSDCKK